MWRARAKEADISGEVHWTMQDTDTPRRAENEKDDEAVHDNGRIGIQNEEQDEGHARKKV